MKNMKYCQWQNFLNDIADACAIQSDASFHPEELSEIERKAYESCVRKCRHFLQNDEDFL